MVISKEQTDHEGRGAYSSGKGIEKLLAKKRGF
jgi:hypothetical protein